MTMASASFNPTEVEQLKAELAEAYWREYSGEITSIMRQEAPVDTGLLAASHSADPPLRVPGGWLLRWRVKARRGDVGYPVIVHEGRGEIRPKNAKALRWVNKLGAVVFAQRSGPVAANPWLVRAFQRCGFRDVRRG